MITPGTPFNYKSTILSQYANSPVINALLDNLASCIDPSANITAFFNQVWNINTAFGYGLDVWGRIVGVGRAITVPATNYVGFKEANAGWDTFNDVSPFYIGNAPTSVALLSDASFRLLILAKAAANITNCSIPAINAILLLLFPGRGNCYVTDPGGMACTYTFNFTMTAVEIAIVTNGNVLPKPVGVTAGISHL